MPPITQEDDEIQERARAPRRAKFGVARTPWWRPRTTFGRILLGGATFIVLSALLATGILVRRFLIHDPHFRIPGASSVESSGLSEVKRAELLPVFGEDIGRNIFIVPLSARRKQLEAIPWVQRATVMRYLPDRLSVSIIERTPIALVMEGSRVELADAEGVILTMPPVMIAQHHYFFPVIHGIDANAPLPARRQRMAVYQRFMAELDQDGQKRSEQVSEIDLSDPEDLRASLREPGSDILAHFGEGQFLHRLQIYKSHIAEWRQRYPRLIGVDLRYEDNVPLEVSSDNASATSATIPAITARVSPKTSEAAGPASMAAIAPPKPVQAATASPATPVPTTKTPAKTAAAHKAAEARKRAARLKAARAAHDKAPLHKTSTAPHSTPAVTKQGQ
jgi:cell division protein FtsQ